MDASLIQNSDYVLDNTKKTTRNLSWIRNGDENFLHCYIQIYCSTHTNFYPNGLGGLLPLGEKPAFA
jgi:hypothetical protein